MVGVVLLASSPARILGSDADDIPVLLRIGPGQVRLNVRLRVKGAVSRLPQPGELPVTDAHDVGHHARTYCYRFVANGRTILVELYDSDFGLHTARLSIADRSYSQCPSLSHEPVIVLGRAEFRLASDAFPTPAGYVLKKTSSGTTISRNWTYSEAAEQPGQDACFSRAISLTIGPPTGAPRSLTVQNWEEPGC